MKRCCRFILYISYLDLASPSQDGNLKTTVWSWLWLPIHPRTQESERQKQDGLHKQSLDQPRPLKDVLSGRKTATQERPLDGIRVVASEVLLLLGFFSGKVGKDINHCRIYFSLDLGFALSSHQCPTLCLNWLGTHHETRSGLHFRYSLKICTTVLNFSVTLACSIYTYFFNFP